MTQRKMHVDIETFSTVDLQKCGVYRYSEEAEILMVSYAFDAEPVKLWDCTTGDAAPAELIDALNDDSIIHMAHNANFERVLFQACFNIPCPPASWRCTMAWGRSVGLPAGLGPMAKVLKLEQQKNPAGFALIKRFCVPVKPTKEHPTARWLPSEDPAGWAAFKQYCVEDTEAERAVERRLITLGFELLDSEWALWALDQKINDRGVAVDLALVDAAITMSLARNTKLLQEALDLCGVAVSNARSVAQIKAWLLDEELLEVDSLNKKSLRDLLPQVGPKAKRVLEIRQEVGKTSVDKFTAMKRAVCRDGRVHGMFEFYGAQRTGRWAGRLVQLHNLPSNNLSLVDLTDAIELVKAGDVETLEMLHGNVAVALSELIRPALVPVNGQYLVVDFSAIEARVLSWVAGEQWRLDVFRGDGKIYEASAARAFHVPIETIVRGHENYALRKKGKVLELACGYQGAENALITMGALESGIEVDELRPMVDAWRVASPNIKKFWYQIEADCREAILLWNLRKDPKQKGKSLKVQQPKYSFEVVRNCLFMTLPSGRRVAFLHPRFSAGIPHTTFDENNQPVTELVGAGDIEFDGVDAKTKRYAAMTTYGGKLTENLVQAVARDLLAEGLVRLDAFGHDIVMHVHDEAVLDAPPDANVDEISELFSQRPGWAYGLPLDAAGFTTPFYRKEP